MAHSYHHAESSARKFGGRPEDYLLVHEWFDGTKAHLALPGHRALRHHTLGVFEAEQHFGTTLRNSAGREVPVRWIGEQHVLEDCRRIPTVSDWLAALPIESWMVNGVIGLDPVMLSADPMASWKEAVSGGQTVLGFEEWCAMQKCQHQQIGSAL